MDEYLAVDLQEGARVRFCTRCGTMVVHRRLHDEWHKTNDRFERVTANMLAKISTIVMETPTEET